MFDNEKEIKETSLWTLYQHGVDYCHRIGMYDKSDLNHQMYNGNQWAGVNLGGNSPIEINYIKTIIKTKVSTVNQNLWKIVYDSMNFDNPEFIENAKNVCKLLNKKAEITWEKNKLDNVIRKQVREAAINSESILYNFWDKNQKDIRCEKLKKTDIIYGDEQNEEIEQQPYIIIKMRKTLIEARKYAKKMGCNRVNDIMPDTEYVEETGDNAKIEKDDRVTILTKLYKEDGIVYYQIGTRCVDIKEATKTGYTRYPIQHYVWEEQAGNARGVGEVEQHINNQREVNKTATRRAFVGTNIAYPHPIVNTDLITNPDALKKPGSTIKVSGGNKQVEDVRKAIGYTQVSNMSADIKELMNELITLDKEMAGAGDAATGNIDPKTASGRAILAMQEAANQPMIEQQSGLKDYIENIALCWIDMWTANADYSMTMVEEDMEDETGETKYKMIEIPVITIKNMNPTCRIEVTAKSAYDKYAKEQSLENLANSTLFLPQNAQMLEDYIELLDDDANMPKATLLRLVKKRKQRQARIAEMKSQGQLMQQQVEQYLNQQQISNMEQVQNEIQNQ